MDGKKINLGGAPPIFKLDDEQKKIISFSAHSDKSDDLKKIENKILSIKDILCKK